MASTEARSVWSRPMTMAAVAFLFHGPGLRVLTPFRFSPELLRTNLIAVGATLALSAVAAFVVPSARLLTAAAVFTAGHFAWSAYLSWRVLRESSGV